MAKAGLTDGDPARPVANQQYRLHIAGLPYGASVMTNILFVHNNFPAQFGFIAKAAVAQGHRCAAIASSTGRAMPGVPVEKWTAGRSSSREILRDAIRAEADLIRARAAAEVAIRLRDQGLEPDLIVRHPGWGETIYLKEIFPRAR